MKLKKAYQMVYDDMINSGSNLFRGIWDAKHGDKHYMYGVNVVISHIAYMAGDATGYQYEDMFFENFQKSLDNAYQK